MRRVAMVLIAALLVPAALLAQTPLGYLPAGSLDMTQILPPAPLKGEARYKNDRRIFKDTRHWLGTPRGDLAKADVDTGREAMLRNFSCAVGVALTRDNAPKTTLLIAKAGIDANDQSRGAKNAFQRLRPFQIDKGATCQNPDELKGSYDYPSGHTTWGWTWGLILAELAPDRATPILVRARGYGESRIVCGVHNASAVEAGRIVASSTVAADHAQPDFQADFAAAKAELDALRHDSTAPKPQGCEAQAALLSQTIFRAF